MADSSVGRDQAVKVARTLVKHLGEAVDGKPTFAVIVPKPGGCLVQVADSIEWCLGFATGRESMLTTLSS